MEDGMKGCQRKVIFLKDTGSELFDEAYFVISRESEKENISDEGMIAAANRIVSDSIEIEKDKRRLRRFKLALQIGVPFLLGFILSTVIAFAL